MAANSNQIQMTFPARPVRRGSSFLRLAAAAWLATMSALSGVHSRHIIDTWTPYEGLPQSRVLSITQTPDGYLWVSTQLGWIARFDGIRFTRYHPHNTPALVSPEIQKLFVTEEGTLWIADIDGRLIRQAGAAFENLAEEKPGYRKRVVEYLGVSNGERRFVTASGILIRVAQKPVYENEQNPLPHFPESIRQYAQDASGEIWCRNTIGTLGRWKNKSFEAVSPDQLPAAAKVKHLLASRDGGLWIGTEQGLWKCQGGIFSNVLPDLSSTGILQMAESSNHNLWLRSHDSIILTRDRKVIHRNPLPDIPPVNLPRPIELHADSTGGVWILKPNQGITHIDPDGVASHLSTRNGLPSDQVDAWFEDREKNIWLGTAAGLVRLRPRWFEVVETAADGPGTGVVSIAEEPGGDILLGRANGITRWSPGSATNLALPPPRAAFPITEVTTAPGGAPDEFWMATVQNGAFLVKNGSIHHPFPFDAPGIAVRVIRMDPAGNLWLGGEYGLFRWNGNSIHKFGPAEGLTPGHIHDISFDQHGDAWIGKADDTLAVFRDGKFQIIPIPGVLPGMRIHSVLCGRDDNVWIGTVGAGLLHLTRGEVFRYTEEHGLPGDSVTQLLEDDDGFLWGGTHRGIFRVSTTALDMRSKGVNTPFLFRTYGHADGLPSAECSGGLQPACWKASDGKLWFATTRGAVRIDPAQVRKNYHPPSVIIEEMRMNGELVQSGREVPAHPGHHFGPGRHHFEFHFTGISFTAPEQVSFQWKLNGVDNGWVDGKTQRSATYTGLPPGDYLFSVRARNNDGVWSLQPATTSFHIQPWFWQRPVVKAAFITSLLAAIYLLVTGISRRRHQRELRHLEFERSLEQQRFHHKQAIQAERARIAAELHDDLGANLTQIQWLGDAATRSSNLDAHENEIIARISRKSREMVRLIDEIVWAVNPNNDTLENLVTYVCNFAEQYFRDTDTRCRIDVTDTIPAHKLESDCRHHLFLIVKEALHNVAKHAATHRVWVRVRCDGECFRVVVEDKGKGFDPTLPETGDGLANMRNRAKLAGAALSIHSTPGGGCLVELSLKLNAAIS
jgi:signal transduction histidine kinase/ligand-binding sensor domain-containing protein